MESLNTTGWSMQGDFHSKIWRGPSMESSKRKRRKFIDQFEALSLSNQPEMEQ